VTDVTDLNALGQLCRLCGIDTGYTDIWGNQHAASVKSLQALLASIGINVDDDANLNTELKKHQQRSWRRMLAPVQVERVSTSPIGIPIVLPFTKSKVALEWSLRTEEGGAWRGKTLSTALKLLEQAVVDGMGMARYVLTLPKNPPAGYHRFELKSIPGKTASLSLIVVPDKCFQPPALAGAGKVWGPAVQLYALRSRRNWGIGDFTDLRRLVEDCRQFGADIIGLNPLHALFPHNPPHASPYSPSSRRFLNMLYIDVEAIPEFSECEAAQTTVAHPDFQARLQPLRKSESVDYTAVAAVKRPVLEQLYQYFRKHDIASNTDRSQAFKNFTQQHGDALYRHALYEALQEHLHEQDSTIWGWPVWPEVFQNPRSNEVQQFATARRDRVEFFQYLQWQADMQLAAAGRRSLELGLGIGLYQDLAISVDRAGAEVWANRDLYVSNAVIGAPPDDFNLHGQNWGLPPWNPESLIESAYAPFIETLRANMQHSGALRIDHVMGLMRLFWVPEGGAPDHGTYVGYPFDDLIGILALESQRNRCLVIGEDLGTVPDSVRKSLASLGVLSYRLLYFERDAQGDFKPPASYPDQALVAIGTHDLPTLSGFWHGDDLAERTALGHFPSETARDRQVIGRAEDRARLLIALEREKLLPATLTIHPVSSPDMTPELACAVHAYLANAPSKIMLVQLEDIFGQRKQVNLPGTSSERPNWRYRLTVDIEDLAADSRWHKLATMMQTRRPTTPASARRARAAVIPTATYRLQFHRHFTFSDATELVPYLKRLGVSHCFASPHLKARAGSLHGYDIVDHNALNPEIGSRDDFERFVSALQENGLRLILDVVPNHMGVGGDDNQWWQDVLENGQSSAFANYFDIDWNPPKDDLRGKVLCPVLGDHYGKSLENAEIKLTFESEAGAYAIRYYTHRFPVDPQTYPMILTRELNRLEPEQLEKHAGLLDLLSLITALQNLPARWETGEARIKERRRDKEIHKRRLAQLFRDHADIRNIIEKNTITFNGTAGNPDSFDLLHELLEAQAYRLAYWRVASDEINYRRFFDINDLAGIRTEEPVVFEATHRLIFDLIEQQKVDGLRIDHPDGLYNPAQYFEWLNQRFSHSTTSDATSPITKSVNTPIALSLYIVAEKILASHERLPENWSVHGTTGYDFTNLVNGLFVYGPAERELDRLYRRFAGPQPDFDDLLYECKKTVMRASLSSELHVLTNYLDRISESDRDTRDFTGTAQRTALFEVVACFPVYRTYVTKERVTDEDRRYVDWAISAAKRRSLGADVSIFDFIRRILLLEDLEGSDERYKNTVAEFAMRFQQYTAPVMAKGLEDTMFYRYNRLVSLNEVGGDLKRYAVSMAAFHHANQERLRRWPHAMLCTSSHDTKRSEDVRSRINVLSEVASGWRTHLTRWSRINRSKKRRLDAGWAPDPNDEYLIYQTLLGIWPTAPLDDKHLAEMRERIEAYMLKAIREAKAHTSWINPNREYEEGTVAFVRAVLNSPERNLFLDDFLPFQRQVARLGQFNSLSQTAIKLTCPGVPDIYQGTELWDLSLVDPDNRRAVNYALRREMLDEMESWHSLDTKARAEQMGELMNNLDDGRAKLYLISELLTLRNANPELFAKGNYLPLTVEGPRMDHVCAFARVTSRQTLIIAAPRWFSQLIGNAHEATFDASVWRDTWLESPTPERETYFNVLTGERVQTIVRNGKPQIPLTKLCGLFPTAILINI
jgi:(1->4)-alpha-D-glucan 1-alpha-D-glucosylmutase